MATGNSPSSSPAIPPSRKSFEGKLFHVDLPPGFKKENATFDRFGLLDGMKTGGTMSIYFGDLMLDGKPLDPSNQSEWVGQNNRGQVQESSVVAGASFRVQREDEFRRRLSGRSRRRYVAQGKYAYYADKIESLSLDHPLHAAGRVVLKVGAPDSDMFIGFFDGSQGQAAGEQWELSGSSRRRPDPHRPLLLAGLHDSQRDDRPSEDGADPHAGQTVQLVSGLRPGRRWGSADRSW